MLTIDEYTIMHKLKRKIYRMVKIPVIFYESVPWIVKKLYIQKTIVADITMFRWVDGNTLTKIKIEIHGIS